MRVDVADAEQARARMLAVLPEGFEEVDDGDAVELAGYVDAEGELRLRAVFGEVLSSPVAPDWEERWRAFHQAVRIGPLWIGPPWERPPQHAIPVVIDPGRAFGTGAHATTRLSLELLLGLERGSLLDVGCGSGVVAIAAAKLGFEVVEAIDLDPVAVEAAQANAAGNDVDLRARAADALTGGLPPADVAVANIALDVVERLLPSIDARAVVTSGYLDTQQPRPAGLRHVERLTADGWAADVFVRQ